MAVGRVRGQVGWENGEEEEKRTEVVLQAGETESTSCTREREESEEGRTMCDL